MRIPYAAEKLLDYHNSLSDDDFIDLQKLCRKLWQEQFTYEKFYSNFVSYLSKI